MMLTFVFILLLQIISESSGKPYTGVCNDKPVNCPKVKEACQLNQFTIGSDNTTRCPACPKDVCDPNACAKINPTCTPPNPSTDLKCLKQLFVIGSDGITMCPACKRNFCATCPKLVCPDVDIPEGCTPKLSNFVGPDGITLCPACVNINYCKQA